MWPCFYQHSESLNWTTNLSGHHCAKSVGIRSYSGPHFSAFGPEQLRIPTLFTQWSFILNFKDDGWTVIHMCSQNMQSYFSKCRCWFLVYTLQINKKWDSDSSELGQKGKYGCSRGTLGFKWRPFSMIRLSSDSLNLL